jgi:hypothetical protein
MVLGLTASGVVTHENITLTTLLTLIGLQAPR